MTNREAYIKIAIYDALYDMNTRLKGTTLCIMDLLLKHETSEDRCPYMYNCGVCIMSWLNEEV